MTTYNQLPGCLHMSFSPALYPRTTMGSYLDLFFISACYFSAPRIGFVNKAVLVLLCLWLKISRLAYTNGLVLKDSNSSYPKYLTCLQCDCVTKCIKVNRVTLIVPAGLGENWEFEVWEEIIQSEVSLGGSPKMNVTLNVNREKLCSTKKCVPFLLNMSTKHHRPFDKIVPSEMV